MALLNIEKATIRRLFHVPAAGNPQNAVTIGLRTVMTIGQLEHYMNNLQVEEESIVTGRPFNTIELLQPIVLGGQYSIVINNGAPIVYTVSASDIASPLPIVSVANNIIALINRAGAGVRANFPTPISSNPAVTQPVMFEVPLVSATAVGFTLAVTTSSGVFAVVQQLNAINVDPSYVSTRNGVTTSSFGYLQILTRIQNEFTNAADRSAIESAGSAGSSGGVRFRKEEAAIRWSIFMTWLDEFGTFMSTGSRPAGEVGMAAGFGIGFSG